jgi:hypothetical protein
VPAPRHRSSALRLDEDRGRLAAPQSDRRFVDADGNRVAPKEALMQHFDPRPLDKSELDQLALDLGSGQSMIAGNSTDGLDPTFEPDGSSAEGLAVAERSVIAVGARSSWHLLRPEACREQYCD